jgi:CHAT domain-containing protein
MVFHCARRRLRFLGLAALSLSLCLLQLWLPLPQQYLAQASDPAQQVQQGVTAYNSHQYSEAIHHWQAALAQYPSDEASLERAIILENLARAYQQLDQPSQALGHWQTTTAIYTALGQWDQVGRTLVEQAQAYDRLGQPFQAMGLLCAGNEVQSTLPMVVNAQACGVDSAVALTQRYGDAATQVAALGSLGEVYRAVQEYDAALSVLQQALALAQGLGRRHQILLQNSLGNTYREQAELNYQRATASRRSGSGDHAGFESEANRTREAAIVAFSESRRLAQPDYPASEIKALLGLMTVHSHTGAQHQVNTLREAAIPRLAELPPTPETAYLTLQLTRQKRPLATSAGQALTTSSSQSSRSQCEDIRLNDQAWTLLLQAYALSQRLNNNRLDTFVQGEIGHFYECTQDYAQALQWTETAELAASNDQILALDTLYLWQWQRGRIYQALEQSGEAIAAYNQAVRQLDRVRDEILASNQNLQFDFRDAVAPVYRELAAIQLALAEDLASQNSNPNAATKNREGATRAVDDLAREANIINALRNIDRLQLAELQNYFGSDCLVPVADVRLDETLGQDSGSNEQQAYTGTALISTIIFPEKTAVILTLPGQQSQFHWLELSEESLRQQVISFRNALENTDDELEGFDVAPAQVLYQDLIEDFETDLDSNNIEVLVFVHDGILRNIPMAALHDGEQYLVERYAVAIAPSLQQPALGAADTKSLKALILGLSEDPMINDRGLGALPAVEREVAAIQTYLPDSETLINDALTKANLKSILANQFFSLMHIATHGQFGTDPGNTFLVMGNKEVGSDNQILENNQRLQLDELDRLIREGTPRNKLLDLIVLSACQTASGDERSSLGLAGVTIRAGAKSALASLWSVSDEATADLITDFYSNWTVGMSKAKALQTAQLSVLNNPRYFGHPAYWSAFVVVGNWQ